LKIDSLKYRVLLWFFIITFSILSLFGFAFYQYMEKHIYNDIKTKLIKKSTYIIYELEHNKTLSSLEKEVVLVDIEASIVQNGKIIEQTQNFPKNIINYSNGFTIKESEETLQGSYIIQLTPSKKIIITTHDINNVAEDVEDTLIIFVPLLLLILVFLGSKLIDKVLIPIQNITHRAKEISINHFSTTIPIPKQEDELKELIVAFNDMISRLKDGIERMDRFNSDVSHELKTPLTIIKGEAEFSLKKLRTTKEYQQSITTILEQTNDMEKLVKDLLLLTRYSKDNIKHSFEKVSLDSTLLNIIAKYEHIIKQKDIKLDIQKLEHITMEANLTLIYSIFNNLIDNAIKYTTSNKNIYISLYKQQNQIHFYIKDEGIGIAKEHISKITDRFYRVDSSRNKKIKGFGLGLSIVQQALQLHNGYIEISSKENEGTEVLVVF